MKMIKMQIIFFMSMFLWGQIKIINGQEVFLKIQSREFNPIVIEVADFENTVVEQYEEDLRNTIINDLKLEGYFMVIDYQKNDSLELAQMAEDVKAVARIRLSGSFDKDNSGASIQISLSKQITNERIMSILYLIDKMNVRNTAHQISEEITFYLVGEPGIASSKIVFTEIKNGQKQLGFIDYDGAQQQSLKTTCSLNLSPCWSADGNTISFIGYTEENPALFEYKFTDQQFQKISTSNSMYSAPSYSPDGQKLAFTYSKNGNSDIYIMDIRTKALSRLTYTPSIDASPSWSPDCRRIAFTSDRDGSPQIYIMDSDGNNVSCLTKEGQYNDSPAWSPNGNQICYVKREDIGFQIYLIDISGENNYRLSDGIGNDENPSWSPNGMFIVYASNRFGKWDLYTMLKDGTGLRRLTNKGGIMSPKWSPRLKFN